MSPITNVAETSECELLQRFGTDVKGAMYSVKYCKIYYIIPRINKDSFSFYNKYN